MRTDTKKMKINPKLAMNSNTSMIMGVAAAGVAGFALGMLLAPKKGSDLRGGILDSLNDLNNNVSDLLEEGREKLRSLTGGTQSQDFQGNKPHKQAVS